jgi:glucose/arabinose dehydrogenase
VITAAIAASPPAQQVMGDTDCDAVVANSDTLAILLAVAELPGDPFCSQAADVDCDDGVDVADATVLLRYLTGLLGNTSSSAWSCVPIGAPIPTPTPTLRPGECPHLPPPVQSTAAGNDPLPGAYTMTLLPTDADRGRLTDIAMAPGEQGAAIITVKTGQMWKVCLASDMPAQPFGDLSARVVSTSDEGLHSIAFDPTDPYIVYLNYTTGTSFYNGVGPPPADPKRSVISRFRVEDGAVVEASEEVIIEVWHPWSWHNVGEIAFGPDGFLYIGSGDGGSTPANGQTLNDLWGGILRIDVSGDAPYEVPATNPFVDGPDGNADELWAYGLRNPWRFSFDSQTGLMWIGDAGDITWEEINVGQAGANYGWNILEGNECTGDHGCDTTGMTPPRAVYSHNLGCAVIGGHVYRGVSMPELDGYFVYADFCSSRIWGIDVTNFNSAPVELADLSGLNLTSFAEDAYGDLVAVSDSGGVYRLEREP